MWCSTIVTANPLVKCIRFLRMLQQISHFVPLYAVIRLQGTIQIMYYYYYYHYYYLTSVVDSWDKNTIDRTCTAKSCPQSDTHTHTRLTALYQGLPMWAGTRKVKPVGIFLKQETLTGSGISWAVCKPAPRSRQITMPAAHHSFFYRPDALPATQPTASKHWRTEVTKIEIYSVC